MLRRRIGAKIKAGILTGLIIISFVGSNNSVEASSRLTPQSICIDPIKVMPLGDSITVGKYSGDDISEGANADDIGYRYDLWDLMVSDGYNVDFVGTSSNGFAYSLPFSEYQHEGHNGVIDSYIANNIYDDGDNWLNMNQPDVVLLHIGTNTPRDPNEVERILDEIDDYEINTGNVVVVILARIIKKGSDPSIAQFNSDVVSLVSTRADYDSEVFIVDMENGAGINYSPYTNPSPGDMLEDLIHPYATGYTKMAAVWKAKFDEIYTACSSNNNPPTVDTPDPQTDNEGDSVSLQIIANDDDGDPLTYSAANLPDGLSINPSSGLISGTISQTAAQGNYDNVQVSVRDGKPLGTTTVSFTWNVSAVNVAPVIQNVPNQDNAENDDIALQINVTDEDNDSLTFDAVGLPPDLSIDPNSGLVSGTINYDASNGSPYSVSVTVEDDGNPPMEDTLNFTWSIANTNRPPVLTVPTTHRRDDEGTTIDPPIKIKARDPDGDSLIFDANNLPTGLSIKQINATTAEISGSISYNATNGQSSYEYDVQVILTDDADSPLSDQKNIRWIVDDVNAAPQITDPGTVVSHIGEEVALQIEVIDPDGDNLTYSAQGLPPSLTIDPETGLINGVPPMWAMNESPFTVKVTVIDDGGSPQSSSVIFDWIVKNYEVFMPVIIH